MVRSFGSVLLTAAHGGMLLLLQITLVWLVVLAAAVYLALRRPYGESKRPPRPHH
jgi:putative copper export protein